MTPEEREEEVFQLQMAILDEVLRLVRAGVDPEEILAQLDAVLAEPEGGEGAPQA